MFAAASGCRWSSQAGPCKEHTQVSLVIDELCFLWVPLISGSPACPASDGSESALCLWWEHLGSCIVQGHYYPGMQLPLCRTWQPFSVFPGASQGGPKQRLIVAICRLVNVLAFVYSSIAAPSLPGNIRSAEEFRQNPFGDCSQKTVSVYSACTVCWPGTRVSTGSEERTAVLLLLNTLLQPLGVPTIFVI